MAKDYKALADQVIANVGGVENVESLAHCVTRLRFKLRDAAKVNREALAKVPGVLKVMEAAGQLQVVIGQDVTDAYDAILNNYTIKAGGEVDADAADKKEDKKSSGGGLADLVSGIFMPFMGAFMGAGLLKGALVLLTTFNILAKTSSTYTICTLLLMAYSTSYRSSWLTVQERSSAVTRSSPWLWQPQCYILTLPLCHHQKPRLPS